MRTARSSSSKKYNPIAVEPRRLTSHVFGRWTAPEIVVAQGRALRDKAPVSAHARHTPSPERPDPTTLVSLTNDKRVQELAAIRVGRMIASPFAFLRGTAGLMAADLLRSPSTGLAAHICGDAHCSNFGLYASPERRQIMDLNDFDETVQGPWEWDLKRLVASLVVAGRVGGMRDDLCELAARDAAHTYRVATRELASMSVLEAFYLTTDRSTLEHFDIEHLYETFDRVRKKAKKNTSKKVASEITQRVDQDAWHFLDKPPILTRVDDETAQKVLDGLELYAEALDGELRWLLSRYAVADVAQRIVGLGSVGLKSYVVLLHGNGEDALILQVKEAEPSALAPYVAPSPYEHEGERIVRGQRWMQTVSDLMLGWTTIDERPFLVRQFRDMKGSIDPTDLKPHQLDDYGRVLGAVLARAHAQSVDPRLLAGYIDGVSAGDGEAFDAALAHFAVTYADQTERDHAALKRAVDDGRLAAEVGV